MGKLPIVTRSNGSLNYHKESVATIAKNVKDEHKISVSPIAIICRNFKNADIFSNACLHYFNSKKGSDWLADPHFDTSFYDELESNNNYFKFGDDDLPGIYAHPDPLLIKNNTYIILLHLHINTAEQQPEPLEHLLVLLCSRIMEINLTDSKFSIFESANHLLTSSPQQNICRDVILVTQDHSHTFSSNDDELGSDEQNHALEVFQKMHFLLVKMEMDSFSANLSSKIVSPEMRKFLTTIAKGIIQEFKGSAYFLQELSIYFETAFDVLCKPSNFQRPLKGKLGMTNRNQVFQTIAEGIFSQKRNQIIESFEKGLGDIYIKLVSGKFEINDEKIREQVNNIVGILKLNSESTTTFKEIVHKNLEMEKLNIQCLSGILKRIHNEIVKIVESKSIVNTKVIEVISTTALKTLEFCPHFIENVTNILPTFFERENNRNLILGLSNSSSTLKGNIEEEAKSNEYSTSKFVDPPPPDNSSTPKPLSLAIQMSINKLRYKIIFAGNSNEVEVPKYSVELGVIISEDDSLLFGDDYENFTRGNNRLNGGNVRIIKIGECMLSNYGNWSETFAKETINETFLLSLIFGDLKRKIETEYDSLLEKVVTTVPHWFASVHRRKIQEAFVVAGFKEIQIVEEIVAGCCSTIVESNIDRNILVLSENSDVVEMAIFVYTNNKLQLDSYDSFTCSDRKVRKKQYKKLPQMFSQFYTKNGSNFFESGYISVVIHFQNMVWKAIFEEMIPFEFRSKIVFNDLLNGGFIFSTETINEAIFDSKRISVFAEIEEDEFDPISQQKEHFKYYEERNSKMFLVGTLTLKQVKPSYDIIPKFETENGCVNLKSVETRKSGKSSRTITTSGIFTRTKRKIGADNSAAILDPKYYTFCEVGVAVSSELWNLSAELMNAKFQSKEDVSE